MISLSSCAEQKVVAVAVDTFCTDVPAYHSTAGQKDAFKADPAMWESLVDYLLGIQKVREKRCNYGGPR